MQSPPVSFSPSPLTRLCTELRRARVVAVDEAQPLALLVPAASIRPLGDRSGQAALAALQCSGWVTVATPGTLHGVQRRLHELVWPLHSLYDSRCLPASESPGSSRPTEVAEIQRKGSVATFEGTLDRPPSQDCIRGVSPPRTGFQMTRYPFAETLQQLQRHLPNPPGLSER